MIADYLDSFTALITQNPSWAGLIVFSIAMIESLAIIGFIVPGVAIMFAVGTLISNGTLDLVTTILWAAAGASIGDGLSFALGLHYKERVYHFSWLKPHHKLLHKGHAFFEKYGVYSILIGRFVGPIRAVIPLIAGILAMPIRLYIPINLLASALWAPAYLFPGLIFGTALSAVPNNWLTYWPYALVALIVLLLAVFLKKKSPSLDD